MTTTIYSSATATAIATNTSSVPSIVPDNSSFKNRLQEYTQRASIPFPSYETVNVNGLCHAPQFRSSVVVDGETYTSVNTFLNKKAAEQDAAKLALEGISKKIKDCISKKTTISGFPPIFQDKVFCKSILHEFAAKLNMEMPKYDTVKLEGLVPVFITSVIFNGVKYVGPPGVNKKEAEQLAARTAILSVLVDPGVGMQLSEVVKAKAKLFSVVHEDVLANQSLVVPSVEAILETSAIKGICQGTSQTDCATGNVVPLSVLEQSLSRKGGLEGVEHAGNVIGNVVSWDVEGQSHMVPRHAFRNPNPRTSSQAVQLPIAFVPPLEEQNPLNASACGQKRHAFRKPNTGASSQAVQLPIAFVPPLEEQNPLNASACGQKRKLKKKANKKAKKQRDTATQVS